MGHALGPVTSNCLVSGLTFAPMIMALNAVLPYHPVVDALLYIALGFTIIAAIYLHCGGGLTGDTEGWNFLVPLPGQLVAVSTLALKLAWRFDAAPGSGICLRLFIYWTLVNSYDSWATISGKLGTMRVSRSTTRVSRSEPFVQPVYVWAPALRKSWSALPFVDELVHRLLPVETLKSGWPLFIAFLFAIMWLGQQLMSMDTASLLGTHFNP